MDLKVHCAAIDEEYRIYNRFRHKIIFLKAHLSNESSDTGTTFTIANIITCSIKITHILRKNVTFQEGRKYFGNFREKPEFEKRKVKV